MSKYRNASPEETMRLVTLHLIRRAIRASRRKKRAIFISKTSGGQGVDVTTLDENTKDGKERLDKFLTPVKRFYTMNGLGSLEEKNAVNWRNLALPLGRRILLQFQLIVAFFMKGNRFKNKWFRWMGAHIGKGTEIMQTAWLDHFLPELIYIGDYTLIGAFSRITVHGYEGSGRFRYGLVEIGSHCVFGAGTGVGPIRIEDNVRTLPGTTLSPYLIRIRSGSVVGWNPPKVDRPDAQPASAEPEE